MPTDKERETASRLTHSFKIPWGEGIGKQNFIRISRSLSDLKSPEFVPTMVAGNFYDQDLVPDIARILCFTTTGAFESYYLARSSDFLQSKQAVIEQINELLKRRFPILQNSLSRDIIRGEIRKIAKEEALKTAGAIFYKGPVGRETVCYIYPQKLTILWSLGAFKLQPSHSDIPILIGSLP